MQAKVQERTMRSGFFFLFVLFILIGQGCGDSGTPKPKGYPRIEWPEERSFQRTETDCPYSFEIPDNAIMTQKTVKKDEKCWYDIVYPRYKAQIHLTYKAVEGDLRKHVRQTHRLAYEHQVKARNIRPESIRHDSTQVYGTKYRIEGNVASNLQFFVTDSSDHFLRGSLYFMTEPNADSLRPVIDRIGSDIDHMLRTFRWKKGS